MTCERFREVVVGLADVTSVRDRAERGHLDTCAECRAWFARFAEGVAAWEGDSGADLTAAVADRTSGKACGRARGLMAGAVDEAPGRDDAALLREHVAHCEDCQVFEAGLAGALAGLPSLAEMDPGPGFVPAVLARTSGRPARATWVDHARARVAGRRTAASLRVGNRLRLHVVLAPGLRPSHCRVRLDDRPRERGGGHGGAGASPGGTGPGARAQGTPGGRSGAHRGRRRRRGPGPRQSGRAHVAGTRDGVGERTCGDIRGRPGGVVARGRRVVHGEGTKSRAGAFKPVNVVKEHPMSYEPDAQTPVPETPKLRPYPETRDRYVDDPRRKRPAVAGLLALMPGLGHVLRGLLQPGIPERAGGLFRDPAAGEQCVPRCRAADRPLPGLLLALQHRRCRAPGEPLQPGPCRPQRDGPA